MQISAFPDATGMLLRPPPDLTRAQRSLLAAAVVLLHVGGAALALHAMRQVDAERQPPAIEVSLITEESVAPAPKPAPIPPRQADTPMRPPEPIPTPPKPLPLPSAAPLVTSTKPAQPNDLAAPLPAVEPKPVAAPVPSTAAPPAAPPPQQTAAPEPARAPAAPKVLPSSAVGYLVKPDMTFPRVSIELGEEGVVLLSVLVDEQGRPKQIRRIKSSGFPRLDEQAERAMRAARFKPYMENGVAREVLVQAPMTYILEEQ